MISSETESVRKAADSDNDDEFNANAVEDLGLTDRLTLTSPSDVIVSETVVMEDAKVIVSPMELMRRLDEQVSLSSLLDRLIDSSNDWLIDWFIHSLIHWFIQQYFLDWSNFIGESKIFWNIFLDRRGSSGEIAFILGYFGRTCKNDLSHQIRRQWGQSVAVCCALRKNGPPSADDTQQCPHPSPQRLPRRHDGRGWSW